MSKKPFQATILYVILGLVFITLIGIRTISTPQIWTHLAQGKVNEPISYVATDSVVNTTHLYDKLIYGLWNMGGASALILFNVLAILAAFILLVRVSKPWGGAVSQGFALLICGHLLFRGIDVDPKSMMMLFIALFVYLLSTLRTPALLFGLLIPLQILWTNTHDSFVFGPLLAVLAAIQASRTPNRRKQKVLQPGSLGVLAVALFVSTLANPYLFRIYGQVVANIQSPSPFYAGSPFLEYFQAPTQDPLIFLVLILGAGGLVTLKRQLPILITTLAIIGAFLIVRSAYTAALFTVLAFPFMVLSFTAIGESITKSLQSLLGKQAKLLPGSIRIVFVLLVIFSIIPVSNNCAYTKLGSASSFGMGIEETLYPAGAASLINDPTFPQRALNLPADGGYLAFKYGREVFLDYRPGRYSSELLEQLSGTLQGNDKDYDALYETYRPEAFILNMLSPASAQGLITMLSRPGWKLAYFDGITAILLLNKEELAPLLNNKEIQASGLARLEEARMQYAEQVDAGCETPNPAHLIGAGKVYIAFNRPVEAKAIFSLLLKGNNTIAGSWLGMGRSQMMLKEFEAAADSFEIATRLAPKNIYAWLNYASACERSGRSAEKVRAMEMAKAIAEQQEQPEEEESAADSETP